VSRLEKERTGISARPFLLGFIDSSRSELVGLMTVAGAAGLGRALQRDSVRGLRSAFLLRLLRLGCGWFGFVRLTGVQATNWIDHRAEIGDGL
jgi:hypothetical protein